MKGLFQCGEITSDTCDVVKHLLKVGAQTDANNYLASTLEKPGGRNKTTNSHDERLQSDALIANILSKEN